MLDFTYTTTRFGLARLFSAACLASTVLGCGSTEVGEENVERSRDAILWAQNGVLDASMDVPAIGQLYIYPGAYCAGTLIDDHTVLTAGHCVCGNNDPTCMNGGTFQNTDPRSVFDITMVNGATTSLFHVPVEKWALVSNIAGRNDLAIVRLKYRVPGTIATPLEFGAWGPNDVADYATFGSGPGPQGTGNAKRVGLHAGTFTYDNNQNLMAGSGDSGGPTLVNWTPSCVLTDTKIIAVNSAVIPGEVGVWSAEPAKYAGWIMGNRSAWDLMGLPPFKTTMAESVTWSNLVAVQAFDNTLTRTSGNGWTAGASSVEEISAGDGYAEFSTAEANKSKMAGLSHGDNDRSYGDIDYAIFLRDNNVIEIHENGSHRGTFGSYAAGDVFRVEVSGGQVRYRQNGVVFHSSKTPPTYPLVLDTSLYHGGATIVDAFIESCVAGDTSCMPAEMWKNVGFAMADRTSLTRTPGNGWTAGASSVEEISAGDGYAEFSTVEANKSKMAGLSHGDNDRSYGDIDYAIYLRDNSLIEIFEKGSHRGTFGSYAAGDVFRVEVSGGQVRYRQNGSVFHSSRTAPTYPLVLDTSVYHGGATITNASVESCAAGDTNCMPAEMWKNAEFAMAYESFFVPILKRTPGNGWTAGASSVEEISAGDGYAEFSTAEANKSKMAGLSHGDNDRSYGDIDYAIYLRNNNLIEIFEKGSHRGTFGSYAAGDVFRVEVSGGQVRYRQNGLVFHSSTTPPTYPLVLDTSLYHGGATIAYASVASCGPWDTSCMPAEMWKNVGFAMANGASLTRTPGGGWYAGASSVDVISAGDCYAQFSTDEADKSKMAGLSHGDNDRSYGDIDYAIHLSDYGSVQVFESGHHRGNFGSYAAGDVFRVEVSGGQVRYRRNGVVFHSSTTAPTYPLVLDTSLYHGGATLTNAFIQGDSTGCGSVTQAGYCNGDVLVWCEQGVITSHDCATSGKVCGYQDAAVGYNCLTPAGSGGFGYPVGDKTTSPAGGWSMIQVMGHYLNSPDGFHGGHLAQDIGTTEAATANAPVYSVADGVVLYAGSNQSTYVNVVLIKHDRGDGQKICSFYGHLGTTTVTTGQTVQRGDQIATVLDWNAYFGKPMSHLHYVLLSEDLCDASDAANGALICGYDNTAGPSGITDLSNEPAVYTSVGDVCGDQNYPNAFYSPSQFIDAHHF